MSRLFRTAVQIPVILRDQIHIVKEEALVSRIKEKDLDYTSVHHSPFVERHVIA